MQEMIQGAGMLEEFLNHVGDLHKQILNSSFIVREQAAAPKQTLTDYLDETGSLFKDLNTNACSFEQKTELKSGEFEDTVGYKTISSVLQTKSETITLEDSSEAHFALAALSRSTSSDVGGKSAGPFESNTKQQSSLAALVRATQPNSTALPLSPIRRRSAAAFKLEDDDGDDEGDESEEDSRSDDESLTMLPFSNASVSLAAVPIDLSSCPHNASHAEFFQWFAMHYRKCDSEIVLKLKTVYDDFKHTDIWSALPKRAKFTYARLCELFEQHSLLKEDYRARLQQRTLGYLRDVLVGWEYVDSSTNSNAGGLQTDMQDMISALLGLSKPSSEDESATGQSDPPITMLTLITVAEGKTEIPLKPRKKTRSENAEYQRWNEDRKQKQGRVRRTRSSSNLAMSDGISVSSSASCTSTISNLCSSSSCISSTLSSSTSPTSVQSSSSTKFSAALPNLSATPCSTTLSFSCSSPSSDLKGVDMSSTDALPANVCELLEEAQLGLIVERWRRDRKDRGVYWVHDRNHKYKIDTIIGTAAKCSAGIEYVIFGPKRTFTGIELPLTSSPTKRSMLTSAELNLPSSPGVVKRCASLSSIESKAISLSTASNVAKSNPRDKGQTVPKEWFESVLGFVSRALQSGSFGGNMNALSPCATCCLPKRALFTHYRDVCSEKDVNQQNVAGLTSSVFFRIICYLIPEVKFSQVKKVYVIEFPNLSLCRASLELHKHWPKDGHFETKGNRESSIVSSTLESSEPPQSVPAPEPQAKRKQENSSDTPMPEIVCKLLSEAKIAPVAQAWHEDSHARGTYWLRKVEGRYKVSTKGKSVWYWPPHHRKHIVVYIAADSEDSGTAEGVSTPALSPKSIVHSVSNSPLASDVPTELDSATSDTKSVNKKAKLRKKVQNLESSQELQSPDEVAGKKKKYSKSDSVIVNGSALKAGKDINNETKKRTKAEATGSLSSEKKVKSEGKCKESLAEEQHAKRRASGRLKSLSEPVPSEQINESPRKRRSLSPSTLPSLMKADSPKRRLSRKKANQSLDVEVAHDSESPSKRNESEILSSSTSALESTTEPEKAKQPLTPSDLFPTQAGLQRWSSRLHGGLIEFDTELPRRMKPRKSSIDATSQLKKSQDSDSSVADSTDDFHDLSQNLLDSVVLSTNSIKTFSVVETATPVVETTTTTPAVASSVTSSAVETNIPAAASSVVVETITPAVIETTPFAVVETATPAVASFAVETTPLAAVASSAAVVETTPSAVVETTTPPAVASSAVVEATPAAENTPPFAVVETTPRAAVASSAAVVETTITPAVTAEATPPAVASSAAVVETITPAVVASFAVVETTPIAAVASFAVVETTAPAVASSAVVETTTSIVVETAPFAIASSAAVETTVVETPIKPIKLALRTVLKSASVKPSIKPSIAPTFVEPLIKSTSTESSIKPALTKTLKPIVKVASVEPSVEFALVKPLLKSPVKSVSVIQSAFVTHPVEPLHEIETIPGLTLSHTRKSLLAAPLQCDTLDMAAVRLSVFESDQDLGTSPLQEPLVYAFPDTVECPSMNETARDIRVSASMLDSQTTSSPTILPESKTEDEHAFVQVSALSVLPEISTLGSSGNLNEAPRTIKSRPMPQIVESLSHVPNDLLPNSLPNLPNRTKTRQLAASTATYIATSNGGLEGGHGVAIPVEDEEPGNADNFDLELDLNLDTAIEERDDGDSDLMLSLSSLDESEPETTQGSKGDLGDSKFPGSDRRRRPKTRPITVTPSWMLNSKGRSSANSEIEAIFDIIEPKQSSQALLPPRSHITTENRRDHFKPETERTRSLDHRKVQKTSEIIRFSAPIQFSSQPMQEENLRVNRIGSKRELTPSTSRRNFASNNVSFPPPSYVCKLCRSSGHWMENCSQKICDGCERFGHTVASCPAREQVQKRDRLRDNSHERGNCTSQAMEVKRRSNSRGRNLPVMVDDRRQQHKMSDYRGPTHQENKLDHRSTRDIPRRAPSPILRSLPALTSRPRTPERRAPSPVFRSLPISRPRTPERREQSPRFRSLPVSTSRPRTPERRGQSPIFRSLPALKPRPRTPERRETYASENFDFSRKPASRSRDIHTYSSNGERCFIEDQRRSRSTGRRVTTNVQTANMPDRTSAKRYREENINHADRVVLQRQDSRHFGSQPSYGIRHSDVSRRSEAERRERSRSSQRSQVFEHDTNRNRNAVPPQNAVSDTRDSGSAKEYSRVDDNVRAGYGTNDKRATYAGSSDYRHSNG